MTDNTAILAGQARRLPYFARLGRLHSLRDRLQLGLGLLSRYAGLQARDGFQEPDAGSLSLIHI